MYPTVVHPAGIPRQIVPAGFHHHGIHLHQVDFLHPVVAGQFPYHAAVPGADHQDVLDALVHCHGHVGHHLIVDELIPLGQHHIAVQRQDPAELRCLKDIDSLKITLLGKQMTIHPQAVLHIRRMEFAEPHFHWYFPPLRLTHSDASAPDLPNRSCCTLFLWRTGYVPARSS